MYRQITVYPALSMFDKPVDRWDYRNGGAPKDIREFLSVVSREHPGMLVVGSMKGCYNQPGANYFEYLNGEPYAAVLSLEEE